MSTGCERCGGPGRELWPPSDERPALNTVVTEPWLELRRCPGCSQLWLEIRYEPHASFPYAVPWAQSVEHFRRVASMEEGRAIQSWHQIRIEEALPGLSEDDRAVVQEHVTRAMGREPWDRSGSERSDSEIRAMIEGGDLGSR